MNIAAKSFHRQMADGKNARWEDCAVGRVWLAVGHLSIASAASATPQLPQLPSSGTSLLVLSRRSSAVAAATTDPQFPQHTLSNPRSARLIACPFLHLGSKPLSGAVWRASGIPAAAATPRTLNSLIPITHLMPSSPRLWVCLVAIQFICAAAASRSLTGTTPPPKATAKSPSVSSPGVAQLPAGPEPGMLPLPYYRSWSFPGPSPFGIAPDFNLTLPQVNMQYYLETESNTYRTPQNRHVFGPLPTLPSALLLKGIIQMGGKAVTTGTQGALFFHQDLYYKGGAEMGWVYFCRDKVLKTYMSTNANVKGQLWSAFPAPDQSYVGKALSYRMDLFPNDRISTAKVYDSTSTRYTQAYNWPPWFQYNASLPWYVTLTWQRHEDGLISGSISSASLWYLP